MNIKTENKFTWDNKYKGLFHESWHRFMKDIMESSEITELFDYLLAEHARGIKITPKISNIFKCFQIDLNSLKVVLFAQDPYSQMTKQGKLVANGLAMDCLDYGRVSPTLEKLYEGFKDDCYGEHILYDKGNLSLQYLVDQGVMLANSALTCPVGKAGAHFDRWKPFWKMVFERIFSLQNGLIFIFMGKQAQFHKRYITPFIHYALECEHPVAASYAQREFDHNNVFSKANKLLKDNNGINSQVNWLPFNSTIPF